MRFCKDYLNTTHSILLHLEVIYCLKCTIIHPKSAVQYAQFILTLMCFILNITLALMFLFSLNPNIEILSQIKPISSSQGSIQYLECDPFLFISFLFHLSYLFTGGIQPVTCSISSCSVKSLQLVNLSAPCSVHAWLAVKRGQANSFSGVELRG